MLSDSCADFFAEVGDAARKLSGEARYYSNPKWGYDGTADALRRAALRVADGRCDAEPGVLRLAAALVRVNCGPRSDPDLPELERQVEALAALVPPEPGPDDTGTGRWPRRRRRDPPPRTPDAPHGRGTPGRHDGHGVAPGPRPSPRRPRTARRINSPETTQGAA